MNTELRKTLSLIMICIMVFLPVQNSFSGVMSSSDSQPMQSLSLQSMTTMSSSSIDDCCDQDGCKISHCASCAFVSAPIPSLISAQSVTHHSFLVFRVSPHQSQSPALYRPPII